MVERLYDGGPGLGQPLVHLRPDHPDRSGLLLMLLGGLPPLLPLVLSLRAAGDPPLMLRRRRTREGVAGRGVEELAAGVEVRGLELVVLAAAETLLPPLAAAAQEGPVCDALGR